MAKTVTKDMIINDVLALDEGTAKFFIGIGMHCIGCPASQAESLADACMVHGLDPDMVTARVNEAIA